MPTWSGILAEINDAITAGHPNPADIVRRKYLAAVHRRTGRDVILYATKFTQPDPSVPPEAISITDEDLQALMEVVHGLSGSLDLILHSPGGSLEAAEALVVYLRSKFSDVRVVVPHLAMSAATMIACAANEIVMGKHSFLGPTDPQIIILTPTGPRMVAAQAILEQFDEAVKECQDPRKLAAWLPMLGQYGPDLLVRCRKVTALSQTLVAGWLSQYMFHGMRDGREKSEQIADWLSSHGHFKSHSRHIARSELESKGLRIAHLEADQELQDAVLSVFHAATHAFSMSPCVKIVENQFGKAFLKIAAPAVAMLPMPPFGPPQPAPIAPLPAPPATPPSSPPPTGT